MYLISYNSGRVIAVTSSMKAVLYNRVSDMFILMGLMVIYSYVGNLSILVFPVLFTCSTSDGIMRT